MKRNSISHKIAQQPAPLLAVLCIFLAAFGLYVNYCEPTYFLVITSAVGILFLLITGELKRLRNWPTVFLMGYAAFSMLTIFWAMSGRFFLQHYAVIFVAALFFLFTALHKPDRSFARRVMAVIAGISAIYAVIGIAAAALPALRALMAALLPIVGETALGGSRVWGVLGNPNIEASFFTVGIFFSVALICDTGSQKLRALWAASLFLNAVALLLGFSMGAIAFFAVSIVIYLFFAGKGRIAAVTRMIEAAVPALFCAIPISRFFESGKGFAVIVGLWIGAAITVILELKAAERLCTFLESRPKLFFGLLIGVVALASVYLLVALNISAPYTFGGAISRNNRLSPGEHSLIIEADGDVTVRVTSYTKVNLASYGGTVLYEGPGVDAEFTVPDNSYTCGIAFSADEGTRLSRAAVDGTKEVILRYRLLPSFIASRVEGSISSRSDVIQRQIYIQDAFRLFQKSPLVGNGVGSFETGVTSVQDYYYQSRYVHNHYMQILLEDGAIGIILFVAALVSMAVALWKKRNQAENGALYWLYPALCAEFVMNTLHMFWDSSMSLYVFVCCMYAIYGLFVGLFAEPIPEKEQKKAHQTIAWRALLMILPLFFIVTVCGSLRASQMVHREFSSYEEAYDSMEQAIRLDLYDRNSTMLSYLLTVQSDESGSAKLEQADVYADHLSKVQSNSIPQQLVVYYYNMQQYANSIDAAMLGAIYSASDSAQWNSIAGILKQGFIDCGVSSPLFSEDGDMLLDKLIEYAAMLENRNATAAVPVALNAESTTFFTQVAALDACRGNAYDMLDVMMNPSA